MALLSVWLLMMLAGAGPFDDYLLRQLYAAHRPALRDAALFVTLFGDWQVVIALSLLAAAWLLFQKRLRPAVLLLATTVIGRLLVQLQKDGIQRLRPDDLEHLVPVKSLSFPSGHAANSMILFLGIATIAASPKHRRWAVAAALAATFLVGISRPMLGVHYPSDVVGGWAFGALWVLVMLWFAQRRWSTGAEGRAQ